ncbi:prepilin peptidase [Gilliamella sp. B14384G15]|uniref:prepilin peptidase n=1 Tax=unclassified Gilliamella TaxID=2685620 RepID=UPI0018DD2441|nr:MULTISPECIES: A24 family peptidase [unclassified Gilliamella]MBI0030946.1 prepilin peptidase [Gilliamella sp. B14384G15]MBI0058303.1 prepilin peptidase [Gilliamella sp. B14384G12]
MIMFIVICLGLGVGSFINVAYCRFSPSQTLSVYLKEISFQRSICPCCRTKLEFWQLIPIVSWIILKRRCYYCQSIILFKYVAWELLVATLFLVIYLHKGLSYQSFILIFLSCYFLLLASIDFKYFLLPDFFTQPLMWAGLIAAYFNVTNIRLDDALIGILCGYLLLKLPAILFYLISNKQGLGGGDIKLLAALGTWIPYQLLALLLIIASLLGMFYYFFQKNLLKKQSLTIIPFGPFLLISGYCLCYFSQEVSGQLYVLVNNL